MNSYLNKTEQNMGRKLTDLTPTYNSAYYEKLRKGNSEENMKDGKRSIEIGADIEEDWWLPNTKKNQNPENLQFGFFGNNEEGTKESKGDNTTYY